MPKLPQGLSATEETGAPRAPPWGPGRGGGGPPRTLSAELRRRLLRRPAGGQMVASRYAWGGGCYKTLRRVV
jgi:hypothetical protein